MLKNNIQIILAKELELIVDAEITTEAMILSNNIGYCYPFPKDYELYIKLNDTLEDILSKEPSNRDLYIVVYNTTNNESIVGFKLPSGSNIFLKLKRPEYSDVVKKEILSLIKKLRKISEENNFN